MLAYKNCRPFLSLALLLFFAFVPCTIAAAVNVENQGEMICIPNATFHIDCNSCRCSPTGMSIDCTDWSCSTLKIPHDLLLNLTLDCPPGRIFLYNSVKCLCGGSGRWATCSSARAELAHNLRPTSGPIISFAESAAECKPGSVFKAECDTCICAEKGTGAACLGIECQGGTEAECNRAKNPFHRKSCVPYTTFSLDCNRCLCSSDGYILHCDSYPCLGVEIRDDQLLNITFRCQRGGSFLYNAYECLCSRDGRGALCSPADDLKIREFRESGKEVFSIAESRDLCTPGVIFREECNICICGRDETAACTSIDCKLFYERSVNGDEDGYRVVPKEEIWKQRKRNSKYCRRHSASAYCKYLRS